MEHEKHSSDDLQRTRVIFAGLWGFDLSGDRTVAFTPLAPTLGHGNQVMHWNGTMLMSSGSLNENDYRIYSRVENPVTMTQLLNTLPDSGIRVLGGTAKDVPAIRVCVESVTGIIPFSHIKTSSMFDACGDLTSGVCDVSNCYPECMCLVHIRMSISELCRSVRVEQGSRNLNLECQEKPSNGNTDGPPTEESLSFLSAAEIALLVPQDATHTHPAKPGPC